MSGVSTPETPVKPGNVALSFSNITAYMLVNGKIPFIDCPIDISSIEHQFGSRAQLGHPFSVYVISNGAAIKLSRETEFIWYCDLKAFELEAADICKSHILGIIQLQRACFTCIETQAKKIQVQQNRMLSCSETDPALPFIVLRSWKFHAEVSIARGSVFERTRHLQSKDEMKAWALISNSACEPSSTQVVDAKQPNAPDHGMYNDANIPHQKPLSNDCGVVILCALGIHHDLEYNYLTAEHPRADIRAILEANKINGLIGENKINPQTLTSLGEGCYLDDNVMCPALDVIREGLPKTHFIGDGYYFKLCEELELSSGYNTKPCLVKLRKVLSKYQFEFTTSSVLDLVVNIAPQKHWIVVRIDFGNQAVTVMCGLGSTLKYQAYVQTACRAVVRILFADKCDAPNWLQPSIWLHRNAFRQFYPDSTLATDPSPRLPQSKPVKSSSAPSTSATPSLLFPESEPVNSAKLFRKIAAVFTETTKAALKRGTNPLKFNRAAAKTADSTATVKSAPLESVSLNSLRQPAAPFLKSMKSVKAVKDVEATVDHSRLTVGDVVRVHLDAYNIEAYSLVLVTEIKLPEICGFPSFPSLDTTYFEPQWRKISPDGSYGPLKLGTEISKSLPNGKLSDAKLAAIKLKWESSSHQDAPNVVLLLQRRIDGTSGVPLVHAFHETVHTLTLRISTVNII